jgi:hypothetical protein
MIELIFLVEALAAIEIFAIRGAREAEEREKKDAAHVEARF